MVHTEIQEKRGKKYYYRVKSIRDKDRVFKERIYLGANLTKEELEKKQKEADKTLGIFESILTKDEKKILEKIKEEFFREPKENYENRYEAFCSLFTYDSTGIEGNTLTLLETSHLLFDGIVPKEKSLREVYEIINHKKAFDYLLTYRGDINKNFILNLHALVVARTL